MYVCTYVVHIPTWCLQKRTEDNQNSDYKNGYKKKLNGTNIKMKKMIGRYLRHCKRCV